MKSGSASFLSHQHNVVNKFITSKYFPMSCSLHWKKCFIYYVSYWASLVAQLVSFLSGIRVIKSAESSFAFELF